MSLNTIFEELSATSSRNAKEDILRANDTPLLRKIIRLALDPMIQFYIRIIPEYFPGSLDSISLEDALDGLTKLTTRKLTGHAAINYLQDLLSSLGRSDALVLERVIQKDLKCGVGPGTINKVFGKGFVTEYPVMLCSPMNEKTLAKIIFPALVQLKADGMRFNAVVKDDKVAFYSRNGKFIDLLGNLETEFLSAANGRDVVYDGELLVWDTDRGVPAPRETGNGILNKAVKGTISDDEAATVRTVLWDVIPYETFMGNVPSEHYSERFAALIFDIQRTNSNLLMAITTDEVNSLEEADVIFRRYLSQGQEGVILKNTNSLWEPKRVQTQVKMKAEETADLLCVGWEEGTGKYVGMLGALKMQTADGVIKVDVGTGFTDAQRRELTEDVTVGKVFEIKYNTKIADKRTKQQSLFLPVFVGERPDKTTADFASTLK